MNSHKTRIVLGCILVVLVGSLLYSKPWGTKPLKNLSVSEIQEITVRLTPPEITFAVNDKELVDIIMTLNSIVIYRKGNSNEPLAGQDVVFTITKTDGTVISVRPLGGNLITIDGIRYYTKDEPNARLVYLGNNLERAKEG